MLETRDASASILVTVSACNQHLFESMVMIAAPCAAHGGLRPNIWLIFFGQVCRHENCASAAADDALWCTDSSCTWCELTRGLERAPHRRFSSAWNAHAATMQSAMGRRRLQVPASGAAVTLNAAASLCRLRLLANSAVGLSAACEVGRTALTLCGCGITLTPASPSPALAHLH